MLEQPDYYLAQLDRPRAERPPEWRTPVWVDAVLRSALLEVKERDALAEQNVILSTTIANLHDNIRKANSKWEGLERNFYLINDALAAENVRLREALIYRVCRSCSLKPGSAECQAVECWTEVQAALSLQPPTVSPSAPEAVSGDSEPGPTVADVYFGTGTNSELERRIQKLEQIVDGIRCWTEQHGAAALEEEASHE